MWIFSAIANAVGRNFIGSPNYLYDLIFNRAKAEGGVTEAQQCTIDQISYIEKTGLLSQASLLVTPTSYKEGKLYADLPINGNGDFTATRATTATRVNAAGLVDLVPYNLLSYSEQFDNAYWTKVNSTITANAETAPNGTLTADLFTKTSNVNTVSQVVTTSITYITTGAHTLSVYVKPNVGNQILLRLDNVGNTANFIFDFTTKTFTNTGANVISSSFDELPNGWFRLKVTGNVISTVWSLTPCNLFSNPTNDSMFIWGAQLVEGTSARDYLRTETRLNIPRVDYSLGGCPNILLEPQRTNLALQSSSFDSASWLKNASTVTANSTISPSGIVDADKLIPNTLLGAHTVVQAFSIVNSAVYTASVYAKKGEYIGLRMNYVSSGNTNVSVNLETGVISGASGTAYLSSSITNVDNGWYRITMTFTAPVGTNALGLIVENPVGTVNFSGDGTSGLFLWGAQLEAGAYATSFIPTTTASVTRNADSITRNNIFTNGLITAAGGTWFLELRNNRVLTRDGFQNGFSLDDSSFANAIRIAVLSTGRVSILLNWGGTSSTVFTTTVDNCKLALKFNGSIMDIFQNGVKVVNATTFAPNISLMNNLRVNPTGTPFFLNETALFPTPLTDAQMSMLTSDIYPTAAAAYASLGLVSESPSCLTSTTTF